MGMWTAESVHGVQASLEYKHPISICPAGVLIMRMAIVERNDLMQERLTADKRERYRRSTRILTNSRTSQSEKQRESRDRETAARKPRNNKSQAHTTNGTRARGRWEPGQKLRLRTGPVLEISEYTRLENAQSEAQLKKLHPPIWARLLVGVKHPCTGV
jgi:hypothetical protein